MVCHERRTREWPGLMWGQESGSNQTRQIRDRPGGIDAARRRPQGPRTYAPSRLRVGLGLYLGRSSYPIRGLDSSGARDARARRALHARAVGLVFILKTRCGTVCAPGSMSRGSARLDPLLEFM